MLQFKNYLAALFTLLICLSSFAVHAQIYGEGEMSTRNYPLEDVYKVNVNFYADITIDMEAAPGITITAEENIQDYIGSKIRNGVLTFDQKKWIEPSKRIIIKVGAPDLREVYMDTHDELKVVNVTGDIFKVEAEIGTVSLSGKVDDLRIKSEQSKILAENLITRIASVDIEEDGEVVINATETVDCDIDEEGRFKNISNTATSSGCAKAENRPSVDYSNVKYIDLKIKNNSWSRKNFVVVGPKPDGHKFSYGFPMMPGSTKNERWTVGTKIYKENSLGMRKLLVTLTSEDENTTVDLFE